MTTTTPTQHTIDAWHIGHHLWVASQSYNDTATALEDENPHMAQTFRRYSQEANALAQAFQNAESVDVYTDGLSVELVITECVDDEL